MLMIKVVCGKKGSGKTRALVDSANSFVSTALGDAVFIDGSSQLMCDLHHKVRFINVSEFPIDISSSCTFLGFLCGIISSNFDGTQFLKYLYYRKSGCSLTGARTAGKNHEF